MHLPTVKIRQIENVLLKTLRAVILQKKKKKKTNLKDNTLLHRFNPSESFSIFQIRRNDYRKKK